MGKEESNKFGTPYNFWEPKDETLNNPSIPSWATSMQAYYNSGSTSTPLLNPHAAGSYFGHCVWPNQMNNTVHQYDFWHDHMRLSNNASVGGVILNQQQQQRQQPSIVPPVGDAASIFSEKVLRMFGGNKRDSVGKCEGNLENRYPTPNNDNEVSLSGASGSKESPNEGHDAKNDLSSSKKQLCNAMLGNAISKGHNKNSRDNHVSATGNTAQPANLEVDKLRKERKRQSNRESAKRSRMRKQKECEELHRNMDILKSENSLLMERHVKLSEECLVISNENNSIQEELVKMYGAEAIADLLLMKPA